MVQDTAILTMADQ